MASNSQNKVKASSPVLVLDLNLNTLGIVKSLRAVYPRSSELEIFSCISKAPTFSNTHSWMASKTSLCSKIYFRKNSLVENLLDIKDRFKNKPVILPSSDKDIIELSLHSEKLKPYYNFLAPKIESLNTFSDKSQFQKFAEKNNFLVPKSLVNVSPENILPLAGELNYPVIVKANLRDKRWDSHFSVNKALIFKSKEELLKEYESIYKIHPELLVQEQILGDDSSLYFTHVFVSSKNKLLAAWTGRKLRQHPIHIGTSTMAESVIVEELISNSCAILKKLNYEGYASVEYKKDKRNGKYYIIEVTAGRTWYPHYLGVASGVNIPSLWYKYLAEPEEIGENFQAVRQSSKKIIWTDEYRDVFAGLDYIKAGELSALDFLKSFFKRKHGGYSSLFFKDPLPYLSVVFRLKYGIFSRVFKKLIGFSKKGA